MMKEKIVVLKGERAKGYREAIEDVLLMLNMKKYYANDSEKKYLEATMEYIVQTVGDESMESYLEVNNKWAKAR